MNRDMFAEQHEGDKRCWLHPDVGPQCKYVCNQRLRNRGACPTCHQRVMGYVHAMITRQVPEVLDHMQRNLHPIYVDWGGVTKRMTDCIIDFDGLKLDIRFTDSHHEVNYGKITQAAIDKYKAIKAALASGEEPK